MVNHVHRSQESCKVRLQTVSTLSLGETRPNQILMIHGNPLSLPYS